MKRYLEPFVANDLQKKMVFVGGPRQVGKTTLSQLIGQQYFADYRYLNWDAEADRRAIIHQQWLDDLPLIIFDELHKYPRWKQWLKGVYDTTKSAQKYLITGSARLDTYRRGGDSLVGRYHYWRLHPLTIDELPTDITKHEGLHRLLTLGGFPEPFLSNDEREARRWRRERFNRIIREDIRDLNLIRDIQLLALFIDSLRQRVGSLLTLANIARDLELSPKTAKHWLQLMNDMYLGFPIYPYTKNMTRSIIKPAKVYFFDNADVENGEGAKLENFVATHLLKRLHFIEDYHGYPCSLHYVRDKDGREVDFLTVINHQVHELIEVKVSDDSISSSLKYYTEKLAPKKSIQLVAKLKHAYDQGPIKVINPMDYFSQPPWADA